MSYNWANFYSFEKMLKVVCRIINPQIVVEWGPGYSTTTLLRNSNAEIYGWENVSGFYDRVNEQFKDEPRVHIHYGHTTGQNGKKTPYVAAPLQLFKFGEIDVCFIDGRFRADCILLAYHLIKDNGVVVVHDSKRPPYQESMKIFPYRFDDGRAGDGVGVYGKNEEIIKKVEELYNKTPVTDDWKELTGKI